MKSASKLLALAAIIFFCGIAAFSQSSPDAVSVLVTITNKKGQPVKFTAEDLKVKADRAPATVASLTPLKNAPLVFVLLLDVSGSSTDQMAVSHQAALRIFQSLATGSNRGYFGVFNQKVMISQQPLSPDKVKSELETLDADGKTVLYDAIVQASKTLSPESQPGAIRRALIVISDGGDNCSRISLGKALLAPQVAGVPVFALRLPTPITTPEVEEGRRTFQEFSRTSGGYVTSLAGTTKFLPELLRYAIDSQYLLTFVPAKPAHDGKLHPLSVKASMKGLEISAPEHYLAK